MESLQTASLQPVSSANILQGLGVLVEQSVAPAHETGLVESDQPTLTAEHDTSLGEDYIKFTVHDASTAPEASTNEATTPRAFYVLRGRANPDEIEIRIPSPKNPYDIIVADAEQRAHIMSLLQASIGQRPKHLPQ
ncbi:MAG TPA: hypothetical protein VLE69_04300 [Candidatus Saccharimonadales bacterium]|nr:hypothetical protein [Candidatus Saccharimonadales bacterium]